MSEVAEAAAIKAAIRDEALTLGFDAVGFAQPELAAGSARAISSAIIAQGYHGDMGWLAARSRERASPRALWPEAQSVVVLGLSTTRPRPIRWHALEARETRRDLGLCARARLSRPRQVAPEAACALHRRALARRAETLRRHRAGDGKAAGRARRHRLARQAHQSRLARVRLVALPRRDLSRARAAARCAARGSLRLVPALSRRLPDQRIPGAAPLGCAALHLLSDDRAQGPYRARVSPAHRQPHLWLRRLPCRVPVEQVRASGIAAGARRPRGIARAAA